MKKIIKLLSILSLAIILPITLAAQKGKGGNSICDRLYDVSTVVTITGNVENIEHHFNESKKVEGVHLMVKTEEEKLISVHLGPAWYIDNQDLKFGEGDYVVIKGSNIEYENKPAIIASEVEKDGFVLKLRDQSGIPTWKGWRKKGKNRVN